MAKGNEKASKEFEETGGELTTVPNDKYQKFFDKFNEIDSLDVAQWKAAHVIGYFCRKYKQQYQDDYHWKFNNENPSKCFEVWQFNTLCAKLSANPKILKDYIDWVYENEVPKVKTKFRSISFLTQDERVIFYKMNILLAGQKNLQVDRSTQLPTIYQDIIKQHLNTRITTYGDLSFLWQMYAEYDPSNPLYQTWEQVKIALQENGFDSNIIPRIV